MYYSSGNYEAFAHPMKPEGVDRKSAYIIGTGLAGLTAAFYLVRDGQMKGEHIHLLEKLDLAGGSCDGRKDVTKGFYMRGGREMDNHFEIMWDVYRDVPSIETEGVSVLDEYYWLNKKDPNYSLCRATVNRGQDAHTDGKFELDKESAMDLTKLFMIPEEQLEDKKISEIFNKNFWKTNFWLYWQTMFAFQRWSSALEMKRYLQRYVHHIDGRSFHDDVAQESRRQSSEFREHAVESRQFFRIGQFTEKQKVSDFFEAETLFADKTFDDVVEKNTAIIKFAVARFSDALLVHFGSYDLAYLRKTHDYAFAVEVAQSAFTVVLFIVLLFDNGAFPRHIRQTFDTFGDALFGIFRFGHYAPPYRKKYCMLNILL